MTVAINIWPAVATPPSTLQNVIPSYLYGEYANEDNLQAFVNSQNQYTQAYVDWFNRINLPIYTGGLVSGPTLDWVGSNLYGYPRPVLPSGITTFVGAYNTFAYGRLPYAGVLYTGSPTVYVATDDVYRRCLTWHFYKGDGRQFTIKWLKRRVMRFLYGENGTDYIIDQTYPVSVAVTSSAVTITITGGPAPVSAIFGDAVAAGALELPPLYSYTVTLV